MLCYDGLVDFESTVTSPVASNSVEQMSNPAASNKASNKQWKT